MKKLYSATLLICAMALAASCSKDSDPSPSPSPTPTPSAKVTLTGSSASGRITFGSEGGEANVTFTSTGSWQLTVPASASPWCRASSTSGPDGDCSVRITAAANEGHDERNASITITSGSAKATVVVTQKQRDALLVSSSKVEVAEEGGSFEVTVQSNVDVSYEIPAQYKSWLHAETGRGDSRSLKSTTYSFKADSNDTGAKREGEINFTGGGLSETVHVYQAWAPSIVLTSDTEYVGAEGGSIAVELKSDTEFTYAVTEGSEWLHKNEARSMSSHTVYLYADSYESTESDRTGTVTFTSEDGAAREDLKVIQRCKGAIVIGERELDVECGGGTYAIAYSSNRAMSVKYPDWIHEAPTGRSRSMEEHTLYIEVEANPSKEARSGEITIYDEIDPTVRDNVTVNQKGLEYTVTTSVEDGDYDDARSHEFTVYVKTNAEYTLTPWAPYSGIEIEQTDENSFRLPANRTKGLSGSSLVEIKVAGQDVDPVKVSYAAPLTPQIIIPEYSVTDKETEILVEIKNNTDIEPTILQGEDWIAFKESDIAEKGTATDSWKYSIAENKATTERTAVIRFQAGDFWNGDVTVTQAGMTPPTETKAEVTTESEGSLEEMLGDGKMEIEELSVTGPVNGKDAATLHEMSTEGSLTVLDLTLTDIKKDLENSYYVGGYRKQRITEDNMIGEMMFYESNLTEVKLPVNLKIIGSQAFDGSKIREAILPDGLERAGFSAFANCTKLRKVHIPSTLTEIPNYCFDQCTSLTEVTISEGVRKIGNSAFSPKGTYTTQGQLYEIKLPSTIEEIGSSAFLSTKITEIVVPPSVTKIGAYAFSECRSLRRVEFQNEMDTLPKRVLYNTRGITEIVFPRGMKVIGDGALCSTGIEYLTIPDGVTELMDNALTSTAQKGLTLPESLEKIGPRALGYQSLSKSFTIPSKVKYIGNRAFDGACYFKELHIKCHTPPERQGDIFFSTFKYSECTLYVPAGSKGLYEADPYWLKFKEIVEE